MTKGRFEEEVEEYLSIKSKSTKQSYSSAFTSFLSFYREKYGDEKDFGHFLDRTFAELKKPRREQKRVAEIELVDFIDYLKRLGKSNNTIRSYFGAIQNLLKFKHITMSASFIGNLPPSVEKPNNHKHEWTIEQLKEFVDLAPTFRDKAIIVSLFQSGLGGSEFTQLNYGNVQDDFEKGTIPICLKLVRQKTGVQFKTFFGYDAVKYLRLYLQTRKDLTSESPLFTKWGSEERITTSAIQQRFSEIAEILSFINEKDMEGFNPCRPHSLRAAFRSKLTNKVSDDLIEFWMGHALGSTKDAYLNMPTEELRELYKDAEKYLALEKTSRDEIAELEKRKFEISAEIQQKIKGLEETVTTLQTKIGEQKMTIDDLTKLMGKKVEEITRKLVEKHLRELYEERNESDRTEEDWRRDFTKQQREQHTPPVKEEKPPPPKEKIATDSLDDFYKRL